MLSLLFFILIIIIQIKICKNYKDTKLGLILPIGSFLIAILFFISLLLSFVLNIFIKDTIPLKFNTNFTIQILNLLILIILMLTPTIIFSLIYKHYKKS